MNSKFDLSDNEENTPTEEKNQCVPTDKGLPDMLYINTSLDFEIGTEMEIPSVSEDEYQVEDANDRNRRRSPSDTVASWLRRNVVGLSDEHMENRELLEGAQSDISEARIIQPTRQSEPTEEIATVRDIPLRVRRFERDTGDLRVQVLIRAMRRRLESFFNTE